MRAARTPPEPPPMTNRSTSNSAMVRVPIWSSDILTALLHLGAELAVDGFGKLLRPLVHIGHAELDGARFAGEQLLPERGLVKGDEIFQLLLGELVGIDLRHAVTDLLFTARQILGDDLGDLVEILL